MCLFVYRKEPVPEGAFCAAGLHSVRTHLVLQQLRPEFVVTGVLHAKTGTEFVVIDVLHGKTEILTCSELLPTETWRSFPQLRTFFRGLLVFHRLDAEVLRRVSALCITRIFWSLCSVQQLLRAL